MSGFWSWYVIAIVVFNIVACVWLLWWTGKRRPGDPKPEDTSHFWDGDLTEYNKPMPRWWLVMFYLTIAFGIGYLIYYPGLGAFQGSSGWSSAQEHDRDKAEGDAKLAATYARFKDRPFLELAADPVALGLGQSIFANNCAACHGSDAGGAIGFPNLTDEIWHWGSEPDAILASVMDGRQAAMPALGDALGGEAGIHETAAYVQSLSGQSVDPALAAAGKARFAICGACHGMEGKGNPLMGAPDLTDSYWLYGGDKDAISESITKGRNGMMPAHGPILGPARARLVSAWVYARSQRVAAGAASP